LVIIAAKFETVRKTALALGSWRFAPEPDASSASHAPPVECSYVLIWKPSSQLREIIRPMKAPLLSPPLLSSVLFSFTVLFAQNPSGQQQQPEFVAQGQQLMREGKLNDALALYRKTLESSL
jgi:hypothetical protein